MSVAVKVSSCVDCATTIIGERPRCPACHDRHAAALLGDDDVTAPRPRPAKVDALPSLFARWVATLELLIIIALGLYLGVRSCLP